jgi:hypothetical protein
MSLPTVVRRIRPRKALRIYRIVTGEMTGVVKVDGGFDHIAKRSAVSLENGGDVVDGLQTSGLPIRERSHEDRVGDRCRERFTIRSWCLSRRDSAMRERTPPGWSNWVRMAIKWMKRTTIALGKAWKRRNQ